VEGKLISSQDEQWLDHNANLMNEQWILKALKNASDYKWGFARLDNKQWGTVRKLQEAAGNLSRIVGKNQKHASIFS
jgi:hypothetical protein